MPGRQPIPAQQGAAIGLRFQHLGKSSTWASPAPWQIQHFGKRRAEALGDQALGVLQNLREIVGMERQLTEPGQGGLLRHQPDADMLRRIVVHGHLRAVPGTGSAIRVTMTGVLHGM